MKKSNSFFDRNMSNIIWVLLAIQTIIVAIVSYE